MPESTPVSVCPPRTRRPAQCRLGAMRRPRQSCRSRGRRGRRVPIARRRRSGYPLHRARARGPSAEAGVV
eukprot:11172020-Lingulodinium_polyedra.AAC.1